MGPEDRPSAAPASEGWLAGLYSEHCAKCCAYLRKKYGSGPPEPEDCVQHAFAQLAKLDERASVGIEQPKSLLYRIAENGLIDERRKSAHRRRHTQETVAGIFETEGYACDPETVLGTKEELAIIEQTIRAMPKRRGDCFIMHRMHELSFTDIGRQLGISRQAVARHIDEAMKDIEYAIARANGAQT